jgi:hypothetical protein
MWNRLCERIKASIPDLKMGVAYSTFIDMILSPLREGTFKPPAMRVVADYEMDRASGSNTVPPSHMPLRIAYRILT